MSGAVIYAVLLIVVMSLLSGCSSSTPENKRMRVVCRSSPAAKRLSPWSAPRDRL